jgi:magnesium transporter
MNKKHLEHLTSNYVRKAYNLLELDQTINSAIEFIRNQEGSELNPFYYVLDGSCHLIGLVSVRSLLLKDPNSPLKEVIKTNIHVVQDKQPMFDALTLMQKFHLTSIPVLKNGKFQGLIQLQDFFEDELEISSKRKRLQIFQMIGILIEEGPIKSLWKKYLHRMPWLFCNMLGGIICAVISEFYEVVLLHVIILAMFIPLVLSLSESISMQAMTLSICLMTHKKHRWSKVFSYILSELRLFFLIALTASIFVGLLSLLWGDGIGPSFIIFISIFISIILSAIFGSLVPIVMHRWKLDPKVASGPIVLMLADVITTLIYLRLAFWLLM